LQPYQLADGRRGKLLLVHDWAKEAGPAAVPPEFQIQLDLPGWYAIYFGVPLMRSGIGGGGVDVALDADPAFSPAGPEYGIRRGRPMQPVDIEVMRFWKCAPLAGRSLRLRVPYGTFSSQPWGMVSASISAIRLVRLSDEQIAAYRQEIADPQNKRVIVVCDGFSHYWGAAEPNRGIDARLVQAYRDSDVRMLFLQSPATGVASWPSRVTTLVGDGVSDADWKALRRGDRRLADYVQWAVRNGQEGMRVVSDLCRAADIEFHASLRMNLFWGDEPFGRFANGQFWREHPDLRKPGSPNLDYGKPRARQFVVDLLTELATSYKPAGINLDFTRWPPVADPQRHDFSVLTNFIREIRRAIDRCPSTKKIALSVNVVDGFHAHANLAQQKIDLEAWLTTGVLDFICVEAYEHAPYLALARKHNVRYYAHQDNEPPRGQTNDPEWKDDHDPLPGEEFLESPPMPNSLDPLEWQKIAFDRYKEGVDGICIVNNFSGWKSTGRLGHVKELSARIAARAVWGQEIGPRIEFT
jgi:hypothetical protein